MAGDWIKMRLTLWGDPRVVKLARVLRCDQARVVGALFRSWSLADAHTSDGQLEGYTPDDLDAATGIKGWAAALRSVGWLEIRRGGLTIPRFNEHNGTSAKRRAQEADRKRESRQARPQHVGDSSASDADTMRTREELEERREPSALPGARNRAPLDIDWDAALGMAEAAAKYVPPKNAQHRRAWLKYAALAQSRFGQHWLDDAAQAVVNGKTNTTPQQHFIGVLKSKAAELGIDELAFKELVKAIEVPLEIWRSEFLEVPANGKAHH